jgi:hypothetical protein
MRRTELLSGIVLIAGLAVALPATAQMHTPFAKPTKPDSRTKEEQIAAAMAAAPESVAKDATIVGVDSDGQMHVLRSGSNGFTCMPDRGDTHPAMCADAVSMQWFHDFATHQPKPTTKVPGITYMLAGATQRSDSNPYDETSPLIYIGPHWMIMWPVDKSSGLPTTHRASGSYIMWAGTPYAHVHVMGPPSGEPSAK